MLLNHNMPNAPVLDLKKRYALVNYRLEEKAKSILSEMGHQKDLYTTQEYSGYRAKGFDFESTQNTFGGKMHSQNPTSR